MLQNNQQTNKQMDKIPLEKKTEKNPHIIAYDFKKSTKHVH